MKRFNIIHFDSSLIHFISFILMYQDNFGNNCQRIYLNRHLFRARLANYVALISKNKKNHCNRNSGQNINICSHILHHASQIVILFGLAIWNMQGESKSVLIFSTSYEIDIKDVGLSSHLPFRAKRDGRFHYCYYSASM